MKKLFFFTLMYFSINAFALPKNFVYLKEIDPTIIQEMRYSGFHNFVGRPIKGYEKATCILTLPTALALKNVQQELKQQGLSLKVYDCYRPVCAVKDFKNWSSDPNQKMKKEFYPRIDKTKLFNLDYIAESSGHSRGSTVDLTIVNLANLKQATYHDGDKLVSCYAPWYKRFKDNSIDMGSGYDCLDTIAHVDNPNIDQKAKLNRMFFQNIMKKHGFEPLPQEWWHFTLKNEPFKNNYFNFPVL